jgi:hypothetical protein
MDDKLWGPLIAQRLLMDALETTGAFPKRACVESMRRAASRLLSRTEPELLAAGEYIAKLAASLEVATTPGTSLGNVFRVVDDEGGAGPMK